jgi:hypothetical protein
MTLRRMLLAAVLAISASPAFADGEVQNLITPADKVRLESYGPAREEAVGAARKDGAAEDVATLDAILARPKVSFSRADLTGDWQCRMIKLGGPAPLVVYGWFACKVTDDGSGWKLEKLTGSQRTQGRFYDDGETRSIYLGSLSFNDDPAKSYGAGPETDQVGYAFRSADDRWRIELPSPYYESKLDILELRR